MFRYTLAARKSYCAGSESSPLRCIINLPGFILDNVHLLCLKGVILRQSDRGKNDMVGINSASNRSNVPKPTLKQEKD
jgi:hypothetical protein